MHTVKYNDHRLHFNPDLSGDVILTSPGLGEVKFPGELIVKLIEVHNVFCNNDESDDDELDGPSYPPKKSLSDDDEREHKFNCYLHDTDTDRCTGIGHIDVICSYANSRQDVFVCKPYACGWAQLMNLVPVEDDVIIPKKKYNGWTLTTSKNLRYNQRMEDYSDGIYHYMEHYPTGCHDWDVLCGEKTTCYNQYPVDMSKIPKDKFCPKCINILNEKDDDNGQD